MKQIIFLEGAMRIFGVRSVGHVPIDH